MLDGFQGTGEVGVVGVPRNSPQGELLAAAGNPDGGMRVLDRLGVVDSALQGDLAAGIVFVGWSFCSGNVDQLGFWCFFRPFFLSSFLPLSTAANPGT